MKSVTIRGLKHGTSELIERVGLGESVEIRRRNQPVAVLKPVETPEPQQRPDFRARIQEIYGDALLSRSATACIAEERGDR